MLDPMRYLYLLLVLLVGSLPACFAATTVELAAPDYRRDIRPILSEHCFHCHGFDAKTRKADLRLDTAAGAFAVTDGHAAIVPGKPDKSEVWKRIITDDTDDLMPPPDAKRPLTKDQIALLKRWIEAGAPYADHWAFVPPTEHKAPATAWARTSIDPFIAERLTQANLKPAAAVSPELWQRRAYLDLIGLPVSDSDRERFLRTIAADGEAAYAAEVDRLFASPRYGERMAQSWLDVARYADSHGFNNDSTRSMWRWRDWVIEAFQHNMPFDQFITKQLAGDLLPEPTLDDRIATGFNRNHVINSEDGIIDEEYRVEYVADRVRTVGMAFLGLTLECARCHDHKYDPISQRDYYQLFASFNNVDEAGEDGRHANARPLITAPTREQQEKLRALLSEREQINADLRKRTAAWQGNLSNAVAKLPVRGNFSDDKVLRFEQENESLILVGEKEKKHPVDAAGATVANEPGLGTLITVPPAGVLTPNKVINLSKPWTFVTALRWDGSESVLWSSIRWRGSPAGQGYANGNELSLTADGRLEFKQSKRWPGYAIHMRSEKIFQKDRWHAIAVSFDRSKKASGLRVVVDGHEMTMEVLHDDVFENPGGRLRLGARDSDDPAPWKGQLAAVHWYEQVLELKDMCAGTEAMLVKFWQHNPKQADQLQATTLVLREQEKAVAELWQRLQDNEQQYAALWRSAPNTMVMHESESKRPTHVLLRGVYDALGDEVQPDVPQALGLPWPAQAPRNRLGLAQWLTDPAHPLTARVTVNRLWQMIFGTGLVRSSEDFGVQGDFPSHPDLLDALARRFIASGWDVQALLKELVLSATYRQASQRTPDRMDADPEWKLLSGYPRRRLDAEVLRDQALALSGLLHHQVGGPSVFPYQPEDLYNNMVVADLPGSKWVESTDHNRYRRSVYTYWKRTVLHPVMSTFDAPDRETCTARRARTATPLQALAMLNETGFVEAARHFGARLALSPGTDDERIVRGFRAATGRVPTTDEQAIIMRALTRSRQRYNDDEEAAKALLQVGASSPPDLKLGEAAAWAMVGNLLLNLDATMQAH